MSTRDNTSNTKKVQVLNPASVTATQKTTGLDGKGFDSIEYDILVGAVADLAASPLAGGSWTFIAQESDTDVDGDYVTITDSTRVIINGAASPVVAPHATTGVFLTLDAAADQNKVYGVGLITTKRYTRLVGTAVDTPGASLLGVIGILGHADNKPVTN